MHTYRSVFPYARHLASRNMIKWAFQPDTPLSTGSDSGRPAIKLNFSNEWIPFDKENQLLLEQSFKSKTLKDKDCIITIHDTHFKHPIRINSNRPYFKDSQKNQYLLCRNFNLTDEDDPQNYMAKDMWPNESDLPPVFEISFGTPKEIIPNPLEPVVPMAWVSSNASKTAHDAPKYQRPIATPRGVKQAINRSPVDLLAEGFMEMEGRF